MASDASFAQGWMVQGADEEDEDVEPVTGLTWKLIVETCGVDGSQNSIVVQDWLMQER